MDTKLLVERTKGNESLLKKMQDYCENHPVEFDYDYGDGLTGEQVDQILSEGYDALCEIEDTLYSCGMGYIFELKDETMKDCISEFEDEILAGLTIDKIHERFDLAERLDLGQYIYVNTNIEDLASKRSYRLVLDSNVFFEQYAMQYYDAMEDTLNFFNINPRTAWALVNGSVDKWLHNDIDEDLWEDIPERDGNEYIDPAKLIESLYNMPYSGEYVFMLLASEDIIEIGNTLAENRGKEVTVVLQPKTMVVPHDYLNGASGLPVQIKKEMRITLTKHNQLCREGNYRYGIDEVFGTLDESEWDSPVVIEVKETEQVNN